MIIRKFRFIPVITKYFWSVKNLFLFFISQLMKRGQCLPVLKTRCVRFLGTIVSHRRVSLH